MSCTARDTNGQSCLVTGEHEEIINSSGQRATVHQTPLSVWSVPVSGLRVASAFGTEPEVLGRMLDRARHATPADVRAGGANTEAELLACLQLGAMRAAEGDDPGKNDLGFTVWPNGEQAFKVGWNYAKGLLAEAAAEAEANP